MRFDWAGLQTAIRDQVVGFVRRMCAEHPDEHIYGAAVHEFYAESGGTIAWTLVGVASEERLAAAAPDALDAQALRWSPADWPWQLDPGAAEEEWASRLETAATAGDGRHWDTVHERYLRTAAKACTAARKQLVADGIVGRDFVVVAMDEAWELIPLSLTRAQVRKHFPELDAEQREADRLAALPPEQQVAELVAIVESHSSPLPSEQAMQWLRALGGLSVPAALARLDGSPDKWLWAKLLADIGIASAEVSDALERTMANKHLDEPDRSWAAAALSRLGRMDLVVKRLDSIPPGVAVQGFAAPYTSFRDHGTHGPLDYAPLESALAVCPDHHPAVSEQLAPGRGLCSIGPDEAGTALAALASALPVVRRHALLVLSDTPLNAEQRRHYTARLKHLRQDDPDPLVREAAATLGG
ncbi:DUF4303 domain-containing protein [Streptomyces sp. Wh19]|uniref:DUF4303 domain-containing protein n=1 Tax=Streptomyces sp. Wh19 TaxID=3076629 RepID=UPI0029589181|nr:DUF4303 domain-containing protein [Streptomyces sp. Wh19]MDV9194210.1 DUF4303 domain-containing protein [Streptomyces sp. Wh19]